MKYEFYTELSCHCHYTTSHSGPFLTQKGAKNIVHWESQATDTSEPIFTPSLHRSHLNKGYIHSSEM